MLRRRSLGTLADRSHRIGILAAGRRRHRRVVGRIQNIRPRHAVRSLTPAAARAFREAVGQSHLEGVVGAQEVREVGAVGTDDHIHLVFAEPQMVEQEIARFIAQHDMQRGPRQRVVERRVEKLLDPGGVEILGFAIPGVAHRPYARTRTVRLRRHVGAHRDLAGDGAAVAGELRLPGAGGRGSDLAEPGIRGAALPRARGERHPAIGADQRQLALEGFLGGEQDAQWRAFPGRDRRRQEGDIGLLAGGGAGFGLRFRSRAKESEKCTCRQQRCRCSSSEPACCKQWNPLPWRAASLSRKLWLNHGKFAAGIRRKLGLGRPLG